jgi:hypothetical protein
VNRYSRWQDAMHAQSRLVEWYRTDIGANYLAGFVDDMNRKHNPGARLDPRTLAGLHMKSLVEAEPVWVSDDSCELIDHARHSFEPEPVLPSDPFAPCGFVLLANPIIIDDAPVTEKNPASVAGRQDSDSRDLVDVGPQRGHHAGLLLDLLLRHDRRRGRPTIRAGRASTARPREYFSHYAPLTVAHIWQWSWWDNPWTDINRLDLVDGEDREVTLMRASSRRS